MQNALWQPRSDSRKKLKKTLRELETPWKLSILFFSLPPKFKPISTATFANAFGIWKEKVMCSTMRIMQFLIMMSRRMIMMICCHYSYFFFIFITTPEGHVRVHFANLNLISVRHRKYRLIILLYLHLLSCSSTLDLLFFSGSGASTLARELEPPRPWLDVGAN